MTDSRMDTVVGDLLQENMDPLFYFYKLCSNLCTYMYLLHFQIVSVAQDFVHT